MQRLCSEEELAPENTIFVSGIGCSSRLPHYMKTYGFHGLHGRAFPVAEGIKIARPDLNVFVSTGDGDCCSIGAAHWFYDGIAAQGVKWDITALSYYCMWHGDLTNLATVLADVRSRYGKPAVIAETAYPYTTENYDHLENIITSAAPCDGIPATQQGQAREFAQVQDTVRNAGGLGVFYWEPTWTAIDGNGWDTEDIEHSGNAWENMATFDDNGRINPYIAWRH
jgi:arabinogalactan endo-1,4-beta-galactosidase